MIKGEKIFLRPILLEDITHLNKWKNDEEVFCYLGGGFMPISIDQQRKWMDSFIDNTGNNKRFIISTHDGVAIGFIGLYDINSIHRTCTMGIYIGEKEYWGKGIASDACNVLFDFAKNTLNLRKINLNVVADNSNAVSMYTKLGFKECGKLTDERFIRGKYRNLLIMEKFL